MKAKAKDCEIPEKQIDKCLDDRAEPRTKLIALVEAKFVTDGSWGGGKDEASNPTFDSDNNDDT